MEKFTAFMRGSRGAIQRYKLEFWHCSIFKKLEGTTKNNYYILKTHDIATMIMVISSDLIFTKSHCELYDHHFMAENIEAHEHYGLLLTVTPLVHCRIRI